MPFELETARLQLCPLSVAEVDEFHRLCTGENFRKYLFDDEVIPHGLAASFSATSNRNFVESGYGLWAVRQREQNRLSAFAASGIFTNRRNWNCSTALPKPAGEWDLP